MLFAYDVTFPESTAGRHSYLPDPEEDESELSSMTTLDLSDDEMSTDGDSVTEAKEVEQAREPMRSEGC